MSGICGSIHFNGAPVEPKILNQMATAAAYRGPAGIHHWCSTNIGLTYLALHVTPESLSEKQRYTLCELVRALNEILGMRIEPNFAEARKGDVHHSLADISRATSELGYQVQTDFLQGLAKTVAWYKTEQGP